LALVAVTAVLTSAGVKWRRLSALRERAAPHAAYEEFLRYPASQPQASPFDRRLFAEHNRMRRQYQRQMREVW
jgi:hypothetical protein